MEEELQQKTHAKAEKILQLAEELEGTDNINILPEIYYLLEDIAALHDTTIAEIDRTK